MRREFEQISNRSRRADHWIYLDRSWAQRLGVKRTAGMYRIRGRDLLRRLSLENLGLDASGAVHPRADGVGLRSDQDRVTAIPDSRRENMGDQPKHPWVDAEHSNVDSRGHSRRSA
ncbi:MAG: hypothetical protein ACRDTF_21685 [Pseudonocardiaceae bacterium]